MQISPYTNFCTTRRHVMYSTYLRVLPVTLYMARFVLYRNLPLRTQEHRGFTSCTLGFYILLLLMQNSALCLMMCTSVPIYSFVNLLPRYCQHHIFMLRSLVWLRYLYSHSIVRFPNFLISITGYRIRITLRITQTLKICTYLLWQVRYLTRKAGKNILHRAAWNESLDRKQISNKKQICM